MKSRQKLHHHHQHSPLRKSPRLSPSPSSSTQQKNPNPNPKTRSIDNAGALSLKVLDPLPLKICHPYTNFIRRSTRFTTTPLQEESKSRSIKPKAKMLKPKAFSLSKLRTSPRFSTPPPLTLRNGKIVVSVDVGSKKRCRSEGKEVIPGRVVKKGRVDLGENGNSKSQLLALPEPGTGYFSKSSLSEKCLRSRTVVMKEVKSDSKKNVVEVKSDSKKNAVGFNSNKMCLRSGKIEYVSIDSPEASKTRDVGSSLRRSPRLNDHVDETLALPEKNFKKKSSCSNSGSKKSVSDDISNGKSLKTLKLKVASEELSEVKRDLEKCDLESISHEKCLRSRKIQLKEVVDESGEKKSVSIGGEKKQRSIKCCFVGKPILEEEAHVRWGWRYDLKSQIKGQSRKVNADEEDEIICDVKCHYAQAKVGTSVLNIGDCAYVKGEGNTKLIGRILEFFKSMDGEDYFRVQWFYRAEDTVLKDAASLHDERRLFYSSFMNDNFLDCIISKVTIVRVSPELCLKSNPVQSAAYYYDMEYCVEYSTFRNLFTETSQDSNYSATLSSNGPDDRPISATPLEVLPNLESSKPELALLDLYSGCGGMSTGLCVGAKFSSVNLVTKWAVDMDSSACESLKLNHPETKVRNESADDFLELLRQWEQLCKSYACDLEKTLKCEFEDLVEAEDCTTDLDTEVSSGELEVSHLVNICYGDPNEKGKHGLHFMVRWKGYGPDEDTWEPIEGLSNCQELIQDFVRMGYKSKILPLPGDAHIICGGPPCQGISGYNRYRNFDSPLTDERNRQIIVFMDIVEFLKPIYVLMENVVDIIRFDKASLGRYALSRLVHIKYQARLGTIASGCYGLPQFRLRVFIWGAHPSVKLPQFPLPTHDVVVKYWPPLEFERNIVAYDEGEPRTLEDAIILRDSISDLPDVTNIETREEMAYEKLPETEFQKHIRLSKDEFTGVVSTRDSQEKVPILYDHRPLPLSEHDYLRVCQIPHRKGANFRDLAGVIVGEGNVVHRDPSMEPVMLHTGKLLVPDCVFTFEQGKSKRPYARLWWDETVSTVVTFPHVRSSAVLHPEQDRVLTIRECARLQGFPDFYRFCGTIKDRYRQIGNAVSIPVARALGYALGMAYQKVIGDEPLMMLPPKFSSQQPLIYY